MLTIISVVLIALGFLIVVLSKEKSWEYAGYALIFAGSAALGAYYGVQTAENLATRGLEYLQ